MPIDRKKRKDELDYTPSPGEEKKRNLLWVGVMVVMGSLIFVWFFSLNTKIRTIMKDSGEESLLLDKAKKGFEQAIRSDISTLPLPEVPTSTASTTEVETAVKKELQNIFLSNTSSKATSTSIQE